MRGRSKALRLLVVALALGAAIDVALTQDQRLDYRDRTFRDMEPRYDKDVYNRVVPELMGPDLHGALMFEVESSQAGELANELVILGHADGAFTGPGRKQRAYLVSRGRPVAAGPPPTERRQVLVVLENDELADVYLLAKGASYGRLIGAVDADGDGQTEIWAENRFYHMGQFGVSADLLRLDKDNVARPLKRVADAYNDSCDAPAGERKRSAKTITTTSTIDGKPTLSVSDHQLSCAGER
jgi:hypothetical protein